MKVLIGIIIFLLVIILIISYLCIYQSKRNRELEIRVLELNDENIELEKNLDECSQTINVLKNQLNNE